MSDFMELLMYRQNEHELQIALERRRLQREALAAMAPARKVPGRWRQWWDRAFHSGGAVHSSAQAG